MPYRPYQIKALQEVEEKLKSQSKVCLAVSCSGGKTFMAIGFADDYIQKHSQAKILILTHGQTLLRSQFDADCNGFEQYIRKLSQGFKRTVIQKAPDLTNAYANHNVFISLPQTIYKTHIPHFDVVIIDEGHQFYFAAGGMVNKIIKESGAKKELALTGTPSPFISRKWPIVAIPMNQLLPDYIEDVVVELSSSSYLTKFDDYDLKAGEIKQRSQTKILTKKSTSETLDTLLDFIHKRAMTIWRKHPSIANALIKAPNWLSASRALKKTMIACKSQMQATDVMAYFENKGVRTLISISDDQNATESQTVFDAFKTDPKALILIVVGRGVLGFNMPNLINVIDMTCSINPDRIFQLMSRAVRKSEDGDQKLFLKIVPDMFEGYKGQDYFHHVMTAVLSMTDEHWFTHYNGHNFMDIKIPFTKTSTVHRDKKRYLPNRPKQPLIKCWLGLPSIEFFKKLWHKNWEGNYSYAFTTLGMVREKLLGIKRQGEERNNEICKRLIAWKKSHNDCDPKKESKDKEEKYLGMWLSDHRKLYGKIACR